MDVVQTPEKAAGKWQHPRHRGLKAQNVCRAGAPRTARFSQITLPVCRASKQRWWLPPPHTSFGASAVSGACEPKKKKKKEEFSLSRR